MSKYSFTLDSFKNIQDLIRFMDQKSSAVLVVYGFILTAFVSNTNKLEFINPFILSFWQSIVSIATLVIGIGTLVLLLYKIYIIINKILRPRLANSYSPDHHSLFYFEHIYRMGKDTFMIELENMPDDQAEKEVAGQVFEISRIMVLKTQNLNKVMTHLFHSIALLLVFIFLSQLL